jgi:hypothetical protein
MLQWIGQLSAISLIYAIVAFLFVLFSFLAYIVLRGIRKEAFFWGFLTLITLIPTVYLAVSLNPFGFGHQTAQAVAVDFEEQYRIAKSSGSEIDACVLAGVVAAAWLQAHEASNYNDWKIVESKDCREAGQ